MMKGALSILFILSTQFHFSQSLSVEKIWKEYAFSAKGIEGFKSMKDGVHFSRIEETNDDQSIIMYRITEPEKPIAVLLASEKLQYNNHKIILDDYYFNSDETKILLVTESESVYRRSYRAIHYLYDISTGNLQPLDEEHQPQMLSEYSPDGNKISFIYKNDIYVKDLKSQKILKITHDGEVNKVINGTTDWVYEEEFSITKAYGWSPDSKYIAYLKFNEQEVKSYSLTYYKDLYPDIYMYKYPKAGEANSKVTAHVVDLKTGKSAPINLGEYEYIPRLKWSSSENKLVLQTLNRHQNTLKYHLVDLSGRKMAHKVFYEEKSDTYLDIDDNLLILSDGSSIVRTSEADGFNHIYKLTFSGQSTQITKGKWDVIEFYGIDEKEGRIYYAAAEKDALSKGIYSVNLDGSNKSVLSSESGYNEAEFTIGMKYFVKTYSNANTPPVYTLCDNEGKEMSVLEDNHVLRGKIGTFHLSQKEFITFHSGNIELNGWMIKPPNFDSTKRYPVYMTIYGGPGHNEVTDSWDGNDYMYHQLLAQQGYVVVSVDPHGTLYRGAEFKKSTYLQLGKLEMEDVINVAKELQSYSYIDPKRIGIQGWSYGGFISSLAMTKGSDYFKMGIAIAPVTNWRYYDNIYTERFMRTPQENAKGYDENSPIHYVEKLKGKYLLIHGSGDDNVHYQNTMEMINALVKADKQFDLFIYPNRNHGIYGGNTRNHLFKKLFEYTLNHL
jgi:dipeptidyl-peptidase-4